jgi:hypothetical protein
VFYDIPCPRDPVTPHKTSLWISQIATGCRNVL